MSWILNSPVPGVIGSKAHLHSKHAKNNAARWCRRRILYLL